jgi:hypothetical protein
VRPKLQKPKNISFIRLTKVRWAWDFNDLGDEGGEPGGDSKLIVSSRDTREGDSKVV